MASDLEEQEHKLRDELSSHLAEVLAGKRLILFERLLRQHQYRDLEVVNFIPLSAGQSNYYPRAFFELPRGEIEPWHRCLGGNGFRGRTGFLEEPI